MPSGRVRAATYAGAVAALLAGCADSSAEGHVERLIHQQLHQDVAECAFTNSLGKVTCTLDGSPHCYLVDYGASGESDTVEDYGEPPSMYGC